MGVQPYFVVVEKRVFWNTLVCNMSRWLSKKVFSIILEWPGLHSLDK